MKDIRLPHPRFSNEGKKGAPRTNIRRVKSGETHPLINLGKKLKKNEKKAVQTA
jgi:hypothetical protein